MKICLIGQNLTNLILAVVFSEKKLNVDILSDKKIQNIKTNRTIALSSENFDYLKSLSKSEIKHWKSREIKIFTENSQFKEIINFKKKNKEVFNLTNYSKLNEIFLKKAKKSKFVKIINSDTSNQYILKIIKIYDLVINTENLNFISNKFFSNKIKKDYKSRAYTFTINHRRKDNNIAIQVFTKLGPLAFLPLSNSKTSIVFSYKGGKIADKKIIEIFKNIILFITQLKLVKSKIFICGLKCLEIILIIISLLLEI